MENLSRGLGSRYFSVVGAGHCTVTAGIITEGFALAAIEPHSTVSTS